MYMAEPAHRYVKILIMLTYPQENVSSSSEF